MKKYIVSVLMGVFILSGCGSGVDVEQEEKAGGEAAKVEEVNEDETESANAKSSDVEITLPAEFFEGQSEDEVIASFAEDGIQLMQRKDDGSYTFTMSQEEHAAYLVGLLDNINGDVAQIIESMDVNFIKEASMNEDATELFVLIDQSAYDGGMGGLVLMDFALHAMSYQIMNGVTEETFDFAVVFIDSETGEEFERTSIHDE